MPSNEKMRVLSPKADKKPVMDLWSKQSDLMLRTVYATPAIATAIFAGWYAVMKDEKPALAMWVLFVGVLMMIVQGLILHRMSLYLNVLRDAVGDAFPRVERVTIFSFRLGAKVHSLRLPSGYQMAICTPIILGTLFALMLIASWMRW
jgi:hypothetical protein